MQAMVQDDLRLSRGHALTEIDKPEIGDNEVLRPRPRRRASTRPTGRS